MEWRQISHSTQKVSGLKIPVPTTPGPDKIVTDDGVVWINDRLVGGVPDSYALYANAKGRSACVQHFPWLTQVLQKPQSPSLQRPHRQ
jgi:hypothetical protein